MSEKEIRYPHDIRGLTKINRSVDFFVSRCKQMLIASRWQDTEGQGSAHCLRSSSVVCAHARVDSFPVHSPRAFWSS